MFTISETAKLTGFSTHTLRYYEKIGLLSSPTRISGKRYYSEGEVRLLQFMKVLKNTGMLLEDIQEFLVDGCLLEGIHNQKLERSTKVQKRINILQRHLSTLDQQRREIEMVMRLTEEKLVYYKEILKRENDAK